MTLRRSSIGTLALAALAAFGCDEDVVVPVDPMPPTEPPPSEPPTADPTAAEAVVPVAVFGTRPDPDGYVVVLRAEDGDEVAAREVEPEGGTARFGDLAPGLYAVSVESVAEGCTVEGENPRPFEARRGEISRLEYDVSCPGPDVIEVYRRTTSEHPADRYFLDEGGTFLLDTGPGDYGGTYIVVEPEARIFFDFDASASAGRWSAEGLLSGDCMRVEYNAVMILSDFANGKFCLLSAPRGGRR